MSSPKSSSSPSPPVLPPVSTIAQRLKKKLIQLSLEIDDKTKSLELITEACRQEELSFEKQENAIISQYNNDNAAAVERQKAERRELLQRISSALTEKKELASKVQDLQRKKEKEDENTSKAIQEARQKNKNQIEEALAIWKAGKKKREVAFLERERKNVKGQTIKGNYVHARVE